MSSTHTHTNFIYDPVKSEIVSLLSVPDTVWPHLISMGLCVINNIRIVAEASHGGHRRHPSGTWALRQNKKGN